MLPTPLLLCLCDWRRHARRTDRVLGTELSLTGSYVGGVRGEVVLCVSRLWQRGRSEDISGGEWRRRGMMWRSLRAGPIAMLFAEMASRSKARSVTFTSRMST